VLRPTPALTLIIDQPKEFNRALAQIILAEEQKIRQKTKATHFRYLTEAAQVAASNNVICPKGVYALCILQLK